MKHKIVSRNLSKIEDKNLSRWNAAILEAKQRIAVLKRSIKSFEHLRDSGMEFPEPFLDKGEDINISDLTIR